MDNMSDRADRLPIPSSHPYLTPPTYVLPSGLQANTFGIQACYDRLEHRDPDYSDVSMR